MTASLRSYVMTLAVLAAGGVACLVASGMVWSREATGGLDAVTIELSGGDVAPLVQAGGLLALAAVVAVHATRRTGRQVIGAMVAVTGVAVAVAATTAVDTSDDTTSAVPIALAVAGAGLMVVAGVSVLARGRRWPGMGERYERQGGRPSPSEQPERAVWDALDRGEDPTE